MPTKTLGNVLGDGAITVAELGVLGGHLGAIWQLVIQVVQAENNLYTEFMSIIMIAGDFFRRTVNRRVVINHIQASGVDPIKGA